MVIHTCNRCGYETNRNLNLKTHLLRKNLCKPKTEEIDRYTLLKLHGFDEEAKKYENIEKYPPKSAKITKNIRQNPPKSIISPPKSDKIKNYTCQFCNKEFTRSDSLKKHTATRCKEKNNIITELEETVKNLKETVKDNNKETTKIINNTNNTNNINNTANNTANITINNYGEETSKYMSPKLLRRVLQYSPEFIELMIKSKFFNKYYPENKTVRINNVNSKYMHIRKNNKEVLAMKIEIIKDILIELFNDCYIQKQEMEEIGNMLSSLQEKKLDNLYEKVEDQYLIDKVNIAIANNS